MEHLVYYKVKNNKNFNGTDQSFLATLDSAIKESESWFTANPEEESPVDNRSRSNLNEFHHTIFTGFVDGLWEKENKISGVGWILQLHNGTNDIQVFNVVNWVFLPYI